MASPLVLSSTRLGMEEPIVYGENVIALLQEEKWKIVRTREDRTGEDNARISKRGDSPRRTTANVQQQMVARGGMGRDRSKNVETETEDRRGEKKRKRNQKRKKTQAVTDERECATAEPPVSRLLLYYTLLQYG